MNIILLTLVLILAITSLGAKKSITSLLSFGAMMLLLGIYYLTLHEKLLGLFQIFVYTGGIAVLMLFGMTLIGTTFKPTKPNPWTTAVAFGFFVVSTTLFFVHKDGLRYTHQDGILQDGLFASRFGDIVILFALIGVSLLYGTIKMINAIKPKRRDDV